MVANQLLKMDKPVILLNLEGYYDPFIAQIERFKAEGLMRSHGGLQTASTIKECLAKLPPSSN